jgi:hypothetical protein
MQRSEDAVIHMSKVFNNIELLVGSEKYKEMPFLRPLVPFDKRVINFFDGLSKLLMKDPKHKEFPDVTTFGFFSRKSNINRLKKSYGALGSNVFGRGLSFHIAPSNVPINFAYSFVVGLISGNASIVRVSSKDFPQTEIVANAILKLLGRSEFSELKKYISIVRYEHNTDVNNFFSSLCDVRIIWGGDNTIAELRKSPLPPRSFDITFADRYSFCIVNASDYLVIDNKKKVALDFYNDTYLFDQNACSSPRLIYWVGKPNVISKAKKIFWECLHDFLIERDYKIQPMTAIEKLATSYSAAIDYNQVNVPILSDNLISRIELRKLPLDLSEHTCEGGSFFEYSDESPDKLLEIVSRKTQTLTYIGFSGSELQDLIHKNGSLGIDRVVPCGKGAEFSFIWDGYDLIRHMSRVISFD